MTKAKPIRKTRTKRGIFFVTHDEKKRPVPKGAAQMSKQWCSPATRRYSRRGGGQDAAFLPVHPRLLEPRDLPASERPLDRGVRLLRRRSEAFDQLVPEGNDVVGRRLRNGSPLIAQPRPPPWVDGYSFRPFGFQQIEPLLVPPRGSAGYRDADNQAIRHRRLSDSRRREPPPPDRC